jgi:hypothetical protein
MEDWIRETANRLKREIEERRNQDDKYIESHKLKLELAPELWKELRHWTGKHCLALNQEMCQEILSFETSPETELSVRSHLGGQIRYLHASFDQNTGIIKYDGGTHSGTFEVERIEKGGGILTSRSIFCTVEDAGKEMLGTVLALPHLKET